MGTKLDLEIVPERFRWHQPPRFSIDISEHRGKEHFLLQVREDQTESLDIQVVHLQRDIRHLLMLVRHPQDRGPEKFLCGHDERHWFVAAVPRRATHVDDAMELLKPSIAARSQRRARVKHKNRHKRHNAGFIRQGEWFFIPRPSFDPPLAFAILNQEPLRRDMRSKPHIIEQVYRHGGEKVYVSSNHGYQHGITESQYQHLLKRNPKARRWNWQIMRRNPRVFARGTVKHKDHKTIRLPYWHEVVMNEEPRSGFVAFLD